MLTKDSAGVMGIARLEGVEDVRAWLPDKDLRGWERGEGVWTDHQAYLKKSRFVAGC